MRSTLTPHFVHKILLLPFFFDCNNVSSVNLHSSSSTASAYSSCCQTHHLQGKAKGENLLKLVTHLLWQYSQLFITLFIWQGCITVSLFVTSSLAHKEIIIFLTIMSDFSIYLFPQMSNPSWGCWPVVFFLSDTIPAAS